MKKKWVISFFIIIILFSTSIFAQSIDLKDKKVKLKWSVPLRTSSPIVSRFYKIKEDSFGIVCLKGVSSSSDVLTTLLIGEILINGQLEAKDMATILSICVERNFKKGDTIEFRLYPELKGKMVKALAAYYSKKKSIFFNWGKSNITSEDKNIDH